MSCVRLKKIGSLLGFCLCVLPVSVNFADGGGSGDSGGFANSPLGPISELIEAQKYEEAITDLQGLLEGSSDDPDVHNLLAFSYRQLNQYEEALMHYQLALQIDPEHRGANEYLGELYLKTHQLEKAKERLAVLDDACFFGCKEFDKLKAAIADYQE